MQDDEILMDQMLMDAPVEMPPEENLGENVENTAVEDSAVENNAPQETEEELLPEEDLFHLLGLKEEEPDKLEAVREAAQAGDTDAMMSLGKMYAEGDGVEEDFAEASYWYEKSEDATGFWRIGKQYQDMESLDLAEEYYQKAIEAKTDKFGTGRFWSYVQLTLICLGRNPYEAEDYLEEAGKFNEVPEDMYDVLYTFSYMLALMFEKTGDERKAMDWYEIALDTKDQEKAEEVENHLLVLAARVVKDEDEELGKAAESAFAQLANRGNRVASMQLMKYWIEHRQQDEDGTQLARALHVAASLQNPFASYMLAKEYMGLGHMCPCITPSVKEAEMYFKASAPYYDDAEDGAELKWRMGDWLEKMKREEQNR